jgi:sarcosine dehydrogenase
LEKLSPGTSFSNEQFPFSTHRLIDVGGRVVRALRVSFVGELGTSAASARLRPVAHSI